MKRFSDRFSASLLCFALVGAAGCDDDNGDDQETVGGSESGAGDSANDPSGDDSGNDQAESGDDEAGGDVDNVAACEDLIAELDCGGQDLGQYVDCSAYASLTCDLADYLQCLQDEFTCTDGVFDASGWAGCVSLATCD